MFLHASPLGDDLPDCTNPCATNERMLQGFDESANTTRMQAMCTLAHSRQRDSGKLQALVLVD